MIKNIAIVGAGISGSICANLCQKNGMKVTVFEKSRGVGGRLTSKRWPNDASIDLGHPFFTSNDMSTFDDSIKAMLQQATALEPWELTSSLDGRLNQFKHWVGVPKMSAIVKTVLGKIPLQSQTRIHGIKCIDQAWCVENESGQTWPGFDAVIFAIPAPQIELVTGVPNDLLAASKTATYLAINTMLIETKAPIWDDAMAIDHPLSNVIDCVVLNSNKPGHDSNRFLYAIHSTKDWATTTFDELDKDGVTSIMQESLMALYGIELDDIIESVTHRWRYATVDVSVQSNKAGFYSHNSGIFACGDWFAAGVTGAIQSAVQLSHHLSG